LIRVGHRYPDILGYTMEQVRAFLEAVDRAERDALAGQFAVQLVAARGDGGQVKAFADAININQTIHYASRGGPR